MKKLFTITPILLAILFTLSCQDNLISGYEIKNSYGKTLLITVYDKENIKKETIINSSKKTLILINSQNIDYKEMKKLSDENFKSLIKKPSEAISKIEISYQSTTKKVVDGKTVKETQFIKKETITNIEDKFWKYSRQAINSAIYSATYKSSGFAEIKK